MMVTYFHMINNMKSSKIKTIVVECRLKNSSTTKSFDIDTTVFDDIYLEAATRFAEEHVNKIHAKISAVLTAYETKYTHDVNKHISYNSYFVIINAGFHKKAEIMRKNFLAAAKIDLKYESLKSNGHTD